MFFNIVEPKIHRTIHRLGTTRKRTRGGILTDFYLDGNNKFDQEFLYEVSEEIERDLRKLQEGRNV